MMAATGTGTKKLAAKRIATEGPLGTIEVGQTVSAAGSFKNLTIAEFRQAKTSGALYAMVHEAGADPTTVYCYEAHIGSLLPPIDAAEMVARRADLDARVLDYALRSAEESLVGDMQTLAVRLRRMAEETEQRLAYVTDTQRRCPECDTILGPGDYREGDGLCGVCGGETSPKFTDAQRREKLVQAAIWVQADVLSGFGNLHLDNLARDAAKLANAAGRKGEEGGW